MNFDLIDLLPFLRDVGGHLYGIRQKSGPVADQKEEQHDFDEKPE